jgi:hypothetical protein
MTIEPIVKLREVKSQREHTRIYSTFAFYRNTNLNIFYLVVLCITGGSGF